MLTLIRSTVILSAYDDDDDDDDDDVFYVQVSNYSMTRYKLQRPISYRPHCISAWDGWSEALKGSVPAC